MEQFNLQTYLKNPNRGIVTRDGRRASIVCTDGREANYPIIALIENEYGKELETYTTEGNVIAGCQYPHDLFFSPEKKEEC